MLLPDSENTTYLGKIVTLIKNQTIPCEAQLSLNAHYQNGHRHCQPPPCPVVYSKHLNTKSLEEYKRRSYTSTWVLLMRYSRG